jgi:hypothetical protein
MKQLISMILSALFFYSFSFAADLEIKVNQKPVKLPYWSATPPNKGGVIIIRGGEPGEVSEALNHLANLLANNGWSTVILNGNAKSTDPWLAQLPEAISALRQDKNKRIVVIHYGEQLNMTLDYFSKPQGKGINGLILLSAYDVEDTKVKPESIHLPIFDVVGQFDYDDVLSQEDARAKLFRSPTYLSMEFPGANHDYNYGQDSLVSFLSGWMINIPDTEVSEPPIKPKPVAQFYIEPVYSLDSYLVAVKRRPVMELTLGRPASTLAD